jgi:endonuclease YncB( thermonuclease family)
MLHSKCYRLLIAFVAIFCICASACFSAEFTAPVTGVSDGDTIKVMNNGLQDGYGCTALIARKKDRRTGRQRRDLR